MEKDGLIFHDENSWVIQFPLYSQQIGPKENAFRCLQRGRMHAKAPRCDDFHSKIPFFDRKTRIPLPLPESCAMLKKVKGAEEHPRRLCIYGISFRPARGLRANPPKGGDAKPDESNAVLHAKNTL